MTKRMIAFIAAFALFMLCFGLVLPGVIEWITARSISAQQSVSVEPIDFKGGSGDLFSVLNLINSADRELAYQPVKEGYHYSQETAGAHAADLLIAFLKKSGFSNAAAYWSDYLAAAKINCEAMLVVAPDFPSPWSAILWTVDLQNGLNGGLTELLFDDSTGALLGGQFFLAQEKDQKALRDDIQRTEQVASAYADALGADYENLEIQSRRETEQLCSFTVKDNENRSVLVRLDWLFAETGEIYLILEPSGDTGDNNLLLDPEEPLDDQAGKNVTKCNNC